MLHDVHLLVLSICCVQQLTQMLVSALPIGMFQHIVYKFAKQNGQTKMVYAEIKAAR